MMRVMAVAATLTCLVGCRSRSEQGASALSQAPFQLAPPYDSLTDTSRWLTWRTSDFKLRYPERATILPDTDRFSGLTGRALVWRFSQMQWLRVAVARLPTGPASQLVQFVDSIRRSRNESLNPDWRMVPASPLLVSHFPALELRPDCGDCEAHEVYVALPRTRLAFSFSLEQGLPYTYKQQEQLYRLILTTLSEPVL